jgi:hypothetical protein
MPYQVLIAALAFQQVDPENPMVPVGEPEIVTRGGMVPAYATTHVVNALANAGVIVPVSEPDPRLIPLVMEPALPRTPDQPAVLPGQPVAPPLVVGTDGTLTDGPGVEGAGVPDESRPTKPAGNARKDAWEAYAVSLGIPQGTAESLTKAELQAKVERVEEGEDPAAGSTPTE